MANILRVEQYNNMYDMIRKVRDGKSDLSKTVRRSMYRHNYHSDWVSTKSLDEACDRALYGWPEGLERINKDIVKIQSRLPGVGRKRELKYAVTGPGTLDQSRYMMGHP